MRDVIRPMNILRYVLPCVLTLLALLIQLRIEPLAGHTSYQLFLGAVALSALYGGRSSGLLALALSGAAKFYFFLAPHASGSSGIPLRLVLFLALGFMVAWLAGELRSAQQKIAAALAGIGDAVAIVNLKEQVVFLNPTGEALTGWTSREAQGRRFNEVLHLINEDTHLPVEDPIAAAVREGRAVSLAGRTLLSSRSGTERPVEDSVAPIRDRTGNLTGVVMVLRDITQRRELEEQLRHAQKMEALGRLAGGVAHDFNNLLTVISGHADLLRSRLALFDDPALHQPAEEVLRASARAAQLTRQLLAFSRRQILQPKLVNLNEVVLPMLGMLRSLAGEKIKLTVELDPQSGLTRIDPGQIEQVIMNLTLNARDAMADGGLLAIRTSSLQVSDPVPGELASVKPGPYVMLEVTDTGCGMDEQTRARIFEPFFTTKREGRRTGLGLAIVYGIVKQSGGEILVSSRPNKGSTFRIYLPRVFEEAPAPPADPPQASAPARSGKGAILVAENDPGVRELICSVLRDRKYSVLEARDGVEGLHIAAQNLNQLDLVISDVTVPLLGGPQLVERLSLLRPNMKVLYVSGAADLPGLGLNGSNPNVRFLSKPFTSAALLDEVGRMLGVETGGCSSAGS